MNTQTHTQLLVLFLPADRLLERRRQTGADPGLAATPKRHHRHGEPHRRGHHHHGERPARSRSRAQTHTNTHTRVGRAVCSSRRLCDIQWLQSQTFYLRISCSCFTLLLKATLKRFLIQSKVCCFHLEENSKNVSILPQ